jgi:outer membrane receptor protein involved in Fe transport
VEEFEYKPEEAEGGEVGAKGTFFNGRLTGDITIYRYDYSNLQVTVFDPRTISFLIKNAARSRAQGVELQGAWQATPELSFRTDVAYNEAKYLSYPGAACYALQIAGCDLATGSQDLSGSPLQHSPLWSGSIGLTYEHQFSSGLTAQFTTDVRYNSGYQLGQGENYFQKEFTLIDASVHVYTARHVWEFSVIGRNLGNIFYNIAYGVTTTPLGTPGQFAGQIARPRQVYLEVTRRF